MSANWDINLEKGKRLETRLFRWLKDKYSAEEGWTVKDTTDVHRDKHGDKFPDFSVSNPTEKKKMLFDAKNKQAYTFRSGGTYFTMDESFVKSYRNISAREECPVIIVWHDERQPDFIYTVDISTQPTFTRTYKNAYGNIPSYHWDINILDKMSFANALKENT